MRRRTDGKAGFAAVDALVALVILSSALALTVVATQSARKVAARATQIRQTEALCRYLLATAPGTIGVSSGRTGDLNWRLEIKPAFEDGAPQGRGLCEATAIAHADGLEGGATLSAMTSCDPMEKDA